MKKQMTNEQILKQAIEKARKNGWNKPIWICGAIGKLGFDMMVMYKLYYVHIFSHGFAKAFWGEGILARKNGKNIQRMLKFLGNITYNKW